MKKQKNILKYLFLFFLFLLWNLIIQPIDHDEIYNYGFSVSMYQGLIPYRDFNMVITPLFNFLFSLPFHLFGKNILVFHLEGAILLTIITYFLFKIVEKKTWIIIALFFIGVCEIFPNYNLFCYLLLLLIIYLEKNKKNDYLIGLVIGLCILSKQTIGIAIAFVSMIYYIKYKKKLGKRLIGIGIPCMIFLLYLIISHSLYPFFDLCVLGLFDFAKENTKKGICMFLFLIILLLSIYICIKKEKKIENYYCLAFYIIGIPIFDLNHIEFVLMSFFLLIFLNFKIKQDIWIRPISITLIFLTFLLSIKDVTEFDYQYYPNKVKNFEYRYIKRRYLKYNQQIIKRIDRYGIENTILIGGSESYFLKLEKDEKLGYLDLINDGNWGYHGSKKMLKEIKKNKDKVFFLDESQLTENNKLSQVNKKVINYIRENADLIDSVSIYGIYKFND